MHVVDTCRCLCMWLIHVQVSVHVVDTCRCVCMWLIHVGVCA